MKFNFKKTSLIIWITYVFAQNMCVSAQEKPWLDLNGNGQKDLYENPDADIDRRVEDLVARMTVREKISLLQEKAPAIERLGVVKYDHGNEALHGVVRPGRFTVFPQSIGLAATWNPALIQTVGDAVSTEARARWNELEYGALQNNRYTDLLAFWSPTVNMARDPRWGRTPETYGEDPCLASQIGVAYVKGLQGDDPRYLKVVSTPKHFVANNEEHNRFSCKVEAPEYVLRNYYLRAFQALITEGRAQAIMTAYPAINGIPCTANQWLLQTVLRKEWGFQGYVVSDCGAVEHIFDSHHFAPDRETAAIDALRAGLDLECGDCMADNLYAALEKGLVTENDIDAAAGHVLRARFKLGMMDHPDLVPWNRIPANAVGSAENRQLALEAARQSLVLLKNNGILPLNPNKIKSIAVLGINASQPEYGDYSGLPLNEPVSPLEGIVSRLGKKVKINTMQWTGNLSQHEIIPPQFLFHRDADGRLQPGLEAEFFADHSFKSSFSKTVDPQVNLDPINQPPNPKVPTTDNLSVKWKGVLKPAVSGEYELGAIKNGCMKVFIDGEKRFDNCNMDRGTYTRKITLEAGREYELAVEYANFDGNYFTQMQKIKPVTYAALLWKSPSLKQKGLYAREKAIAASSDAAIVVMGINKTIEMEGRDRKSIQLPDDQQTFIREIFRANPRTILVLVAGSQLSVRWEDQNLPAILNAWYPGEQGGTAIAEAIFGDFSPAGRLPLTYYESLDELPDFSDYQVTNGRTYMYFQGRTVYPFGYGLSYTQFAYGQPAVDKPEIERGDTLTVSIDITNTGRMDGDEVVQLYLKSPATRAENPVRQLKGFRRVGIKKGETAQLSFTLDRDALSYWNSDNRYVVEPGEYEIQIGASSADIRQTAKFMVK
ncbi:MAG: glycoside hydrolase family 3 C-terminal domain-containing protein [Tannerella sp.]|jgi:beta-glucosidase|nr:glycoside hydrolase family 3 C-terminal domain-containing protein [Tannerella sp.]